MAYETAPNRFAQARETIERELDVIAALFIKRGLELDRTREAFGDISRFCIVLPVDRDGQRIRPRDVVYVGDGKEWHVSGIGAGEHCVKAWREDEHGCRVNRGLRPEWLTHELPVLDRDGVLICVGDTLYDEHGASHVVESVNPDYDGDEHTVFCGEYRRSLLDDYMPGGIPIRRMARDLTHECPDSLERTAEDAGGEIAERIRALADREDAR